MIKRIPALAGGFNKDAEVFLADEFVEELRAQGGVHVSRAARWGGEVIVSHVGKGQPD
jgi:hypothetical protein